MEQTSEFRWYPDLWGVWGRFVIVPDDDAKVARHWYDWLCAQPLTDRAIFALSRDETCILSLLDDGAEYLTLGWIRRHTNWPAAATAAHTLLYFIGPDRPPNEAVHWKPVEYSGLCDFLGFMMGCPPPRYDPLEVLRLCVMYGYEVMVMLWLPDEQEDYLDQLSEA